jgi:four helix bundle protein
MAIQSYRDLAVWQKSMDLVVEVYRLSKLLPREEQFALASQLQRASVSIPANIAEGHGRLHRGDFYRHLSIARGSLMEVETHLQITVRLGYISETALSDVWTLLGDVGRLLNGLIRSLENIDGKLGAQHRISEDGSPYELN